MSISCECDYDQPEFYRHEDRRACKTYQCDECPKIINPGDDYRYVVGKWDGDVDQFRMCEACGDLWDSMAALGFCLEHGILRQDHRDYLDLYEPPKMTA